MKPTPDLKPDCSACAALCCVVFAFDKSESFGLDKAAGEVCPNLASNDRCRIFADRARMGFKGCITYDCYGAGQVVTQEVFKGRSWRNDPGLTDRMGAALSVLRRIHELHLLLQAAGKLPLSEAENDYLCQLSGSLVPNADWTEQTLAVFPVESMENEIKTFLKKLRYHID